MNDRDTVKEAVRNLPKPNFPRLLLGTLLAAVGIGLLPTVAMTAAGVILIIVGIVVGGSGLATIIAQKPRSGPLPHARSKRPDRD